MTSHKAPLFKAVLIILEASTHPLHLRGVGRQACGQSSGAVPVIIKPTDFLAQHGMKPNSPQPAGQQLSGLGKRVTLQTKRRRERFLSNLKYRQMSLFWLPGLDIPLLRRRGEAFFFIQ